MIVTFLIFALTFILFLLGVLFYLAPRSKNVTTIPGLDPSDDISGNIDDITAAGSFHEFLVDLHDKFGPVASFWYGPKYCISVASAPAFKDVQHLTDRPAVLFDFLEPLLGPRSIQIATGTLGMERHKRSIDALSHQVSSVVFPQFIQITKELCDAWKSFSANEHIPLHEYMMALSIRMISTTQFGAFFRKNPDNIKALASLYHEVMKGMDDILTGKLTPADTEKYGEFQGKIDAFKSLVRQIILSHKTARDNGDYEVAPLLDSLLDHTEDEDQLLGDVIAFFVGGFHTTGNLLTWLFYYLAMMPDIQEKAFNEIVANVGQSCDLQAEEVHKLQFCSQVIDETLRMSITAPFGARVNSSAEMTVLGHRIPQATPIITALGVSLRDKKYFPDPEEFDPNRFGKKVPSLAFAPFGIGKRHCPASKFARMEIFAVLSVILAQFRVKPAFDNDVFIEPSFGFVTKPETEVWLTLERRN
uniref:Cytochrome P450 20A1 n=1 Tax=Paracyclopina nana TaxID=565004 RepID=A0A0F7J1S5_PARNA|nr:cytochrome P450 20A1 [Paracyclopina nana]